MSKKEPLVEIKGETIKEEVVDKPVDNEDIGSLEDLKAEITKLREREEYLKKEAKQAFKVRDDAKSELIQLKKTSPSADQPKDDNAAALIEKLQKELEESKLALVKINSEQAKQTKLNALKEQLDKEGFNKKYLNRLETLGIDFDRIDPSEPASISMTVDGLKANWEDLFGSKGSQSGKVDTIADAWDKPKFASDSQGVDYLEEYKKEIKKGASRDLSKLESLQVKMNKLGIRYRLS